MPNERAPTSELLRRDIDSGKAGDKVDFPDPAAAPLGADEEAGGRPPSAAELKVAFRDEILTAPHETDKPLWPIVVVAVVAIAIFSALATVLLAGTR